MGEAANDDTLEKKQSPTNGNITIDKDTRQGFMTTINSERRDQNFNPSITQTTIMVTIDNINQ